MTARILSISQYKPGHSAVTNSPEGLCRVRSTRVISRSHEGCTPALSSPSAGRPSRLRVRTRQIAHHPGHQGGENPEPALPIKWPSPAAPESQAPLAFHWPSPVAAPRIRGELGPGEQRQGPPRGFAQVYFNYQLLSRIFTRFFFNFFLSFESYLRNGIAFSSRPPRFPHSVAHSELPSRASAPRGQRQKAAPAGSRASPAGADRACSACR